jgi:hypothetical protein
MQSRAAAAAAADVSSHRSCDVPPTDLDATETYYSTHRSGTRPRCPVLHRMTYVAPAGLVKLNECLNNQPLPNPVCLFSRFLVAVSCLRLRLRFRLRAAGCFWLRSRSCMWRRRQKRKGDWVVQDRLGRTVCMRLRMYVECGVCFCVWVPDRGSRIRAWV